MTAICVRRGRWKDSGRAERVRPALAKALTESAGRRLDTAVWSVYNATKIQCYNRADMPKIEIDFRSKTPIYLQLAEQLRREIAAGGLPSESRLPTVRQLAADLRVNFNTVARAYRMLDDAGLISAQQGRGTFVLPAEASQAEEGLRRRTLHELVRSFISEAARLGWQPQAVADETLRTLQRWQAQGQLHGESGPAPEMPLEDE